MSRLHENLAAETLPSQVAIFDAYEVLISGFPREVNQFDRRIREADPAEIRRTLANTTMANMMVGPGEKLAPDPDYTDYPGIYPGVDADLTGLSIGAYGAYLVKKRFVKHERREEFEGAPGVQIDDLGSGLAVTWLNEYDWQGYVSLRFWYQKHRRTEDEPPAQIGEVVQMETLLGDQSYPPELQGRIAIPGSYPTSGPRHVRRANKIRQATDLEVVRFTNLLSELHSSN